MLAPWFRGRVAADGARAVPPTPASPPDAPGAPNLGTAGEAGPDTPGAAEAAGNGDVDATVATARSAFGQRVF